LCSAYGRDITARTGTNDDDIKLFAHVSVFRLISMSVAVNSER
jgi:hypothetical protein